MRMFTGVAMGIVCALCVNVPRQGPDTHTALNPTRQNFDANIMLSHPAAADATHQASAHAASTRQGGLQAAATSAGHTSRNDASDAGALPNRFFDADVAYQEIEFGSRDIDTLLTQGAVPFELPGHAPVTLTLHNHQQQFGGDRISVAHGETLSTITRRGDNVFATIALPTGSFRLESHGNVSRVYPHRTLAQRANLYEVDYRHVH